MKTLFTIIVLLAAVSARAEDPATRMVDATFKVYHEQSTATGFLVQPPAAMDLPERTVLLVSASHVFERMVGDHALLVLRKPQPEGKFVRWDVNIDVRDHGKPLWVKHPQQDVAVLKVKLPEGAAARPIEMDWLADEAALKAAKAHIGTELTVLTYPMRVEANDAGFPIGRHASIASHPLLPVKSYNTFLADFSTFAGDSGAPVFIADPRHKADGDDVPPLVLGLVINQHFSDEKFDMAYEEMSIHHPLGLASVVQAQFIRETIELLEKPPAVKPSAPTTAPATEPAEGRLGAKDRRLN